MKIKKHIPIIIMAVCFLLAIAVLFIIPTNETVTTKVTSADNSSINTICELATLRCYYHDVAKYEEVPDRNTITDIMIWPFNQIFNTGYKRFWLEYNGIVEIGVKADQIQIYGPDSQGIIEIYMPDAEVLNIDADEDSFSKPIDETGLLTSISGEERAEAYAEAQTNMKFEAENDKSLLLRAKNNAKILLERYYINLGKDMGVEYTVKWLDQPR